MDNENKAQENDYLNPQEQAFDHSKLTIDELEDRVKNKPSPAQPNQSVGVGRGFSPPVAPPLTPSQEQAAVGSAQDNESAGEPYYLKGADASPPAGQSIHPQGTYQARPGEIAQTATDGKVGIIENNSAYGAQFAQKPERKSKRTVLIILGAIFTVIAVGALLFVLLFSAASDELQSSQVDTQLKSDVSVLMAAMESYATDNNGKYPNMNLQEIQSFARDYLESDFVDPRTGEFYQLVTILPAKDSELQYLRYASCSDGGSINAIENDQNRIALRVFLSDAELYCIDNS